ncbi:hypothetical protein Q9L58_007039 [Maublancomyces gigas]|uniref:Uncharacterized protein n=1 Tax=Discina gigas TaxID=1032678 RepID=A0ABR3GDU0_9PEZI
MGPGRVPLPRRIAVQAAPKEPHDRTAEETDSENGYSDDSADGTGRNFFRVIAAREDAIDGKLSAGFSARQQFVQTTFPKRDESSSTFRAQVPFPAKTPGTLVAVAVAVILEVVRKAIDELVALVLVPATGTESLVLILPNSSRKLCDEPRK